MLTGFGGAAFGVLVGALLSSIDHFSYITGIVITPVFLVAGTYVPLDGPPRWAQVAGHFTPLYHCVPLVRHASFGWQPQADLVHVAVLTVFGVVMWRLAIWRSTRRLITSPGRPRRAP